MMNNSTETVVTNHSEAEYIYYNEGKFFMLFIEFTLVWIISLPLALLSFALLAFVGICLVVISKWL